MAESFSREKNKGTHRRKKDEKSCVTPAGTSNAYDVQNEWEENTHTHTVPHFIYLGILVCRLAIVVLVYRLRYASPRHYLINLEGVNGRGKREAHINYLED